MQPSLALPVDREPMQERAMPQRVRGLDGSRLVHRRLISPATQFFRIPGEVTLECGQSLADVVVAYRTWGTYRPNRGSILILHALTGSADADVWWDGMLGPGKVFDPDQDHVVCANILGGCYGTTGPPSAHPDGSPWGPRFPVVSVRDMVRVQASLLEHLGFEKIRVAIGGSLGGMLALEFGAMYPDRIEAVVTIAASGRHSAWCIGLSHAQREAILCDPAWNGGFYDPDQPPEDGLSVARMIAMCTYRTHSSFQQRFGRGKNETGLFEIESYLRHQGKKLVSRFDANSYLTITRAMDSHDLGRGRGGFDRALRDFRPPTLVVSIPGDVLYPPHEQNELAEGIPGARLALLKGEDGHDSFLVETDLLGEAISRFLHSR